MVRTAVCAPALRVGGAVGSFLTNHFFAKFSLSLVVVADYMLKGTLSHTICTMGGLWGAKVARPHSGVRGSSAPRKAKFGDLEAQKRDFIAVISEID